MKCYTEMFESIALHYCHFSGWSNDTLYLYFFIAFLVALFGWLSQHVKSLVRVEAGTSSNQYLDRINSIFFYGIFIVLFFFSAFRDVGVDLPTYRSIFNDSTSAYSTDFSIEPGFLYINKILKTIGCNANIAISLFSFITIFLVFKTVRIYVGQLNIALSLLAYATIYYFPSFNMVRMYLAASVTLYLYRYFIEGKLKIFFLLYLLTCTIHYSAILFLIPICAVLLYKKYHNWFWIVYLVGAILAFKAISILSEIPIFERYEHYTSIGGIENSFGMLHWLINIPLLSLYVYARRKIPNNPHLSSLLVFTMCELLIGLLSYKVMMLGRSLVYYNILFIIIVPIIIRQLVIKHVKWGKCITWIYALYLIYRFYLYLIEYLYLDGIMPYKFNDIL